MADSGNVVRLPDLAATQQFQPTYPSSLQGKEPAPIEWVVEGCIPRGAVTLLAGPPDVGKSYLAQQLMTAAAMGFDWLERRVEPCRTFALFSEDSERVLHFRQDKISTHYGIEHGDLELNASWLSRDGGDATLLSFDRFAHAGVPSKLWQRDLVPYIFDAGVQLVIFDNARRIFRGNENDPNQVGALIEMLTKLAIAINGAVLLPLHPPKAGTSYYSGSGAWESSVRSAISLERPKHYDHYTQEPYDERALWVRKGNWSSGQRPMIPLRFQNGVFVAEEARTRKVSLSAQERTDLDYRLLHGLQRRLSNGALVPADPQAAGSLPKLAKAQTPEWREWPLVWFADSVERLIEHGQVVRVMVRNRVVLRVPGMELPGETEWRAL